MLRPVLARPHEEDIMKKAAIKFGRRDIIRSVGATMALGMLCPQRLWGATSKYQLTDIRVPMAPDNPAVLFDAAKCVQCGQCKTVCERMMSVSGFYDLAKSGEIWKNAENRGKN